MACLSDVALAVDRHMGGAFSWQGEHCAAAVGRVLRDLGHAIPEDFFAPYEGRKAACAALGGSVAEVADDMARRLGWHEIAPDTATDGDVGLRENTLAIRCGIWWAAQAEDGYLLLPRVDRAWRPE